MNLRCFITRRHSLGPARLKPCPCPDGCDRLYAKAECMRCLRTIALKVDLYERALAERRRTRMREALRWLGRYWLLAEPLAPVAETPRASFVENISRRAAERRIRAVAGGAR